MFSRHRLEALSDAVFAIAMTLLILDIKVPTTIGPEGLGADLRHEGHAWISFVVTFGIASLFWVFQHRVFELLNEVGQQPVALTFVFLGFVSVLPFSTALWGHHISQPLAFMVYFGNQFCVALALVLKLEVARSLGHVHPGEDFELLRLRLWLFCVIMGSAAIASRLVPIQYISLIPLALALVGKQLRNRQERKWALRRATQPASAPPSLPPSEPARIP